MTSLRRGTKGDIFREIQSRFFAKLAAHAVDILGHSTNPHPLALSHGAASVPTNTERSPNGSISSMRERTRMVRGVSLDQMRIDPLILRMRSGSKAVLMIEQMT